MFSILGADKKAVAIVLVAGLGYFVDAFDILLFTVLRVPSLTELGFTGEALTREGVYLLNLQMIGALVGGVFWGVLGDKHGRIEALFGTILMYSLANIANAFVTNLDQYAICRFVAGFGLAGELGIGITMVAEAMGGKSRGYGATVFALLGVSGTIAAGLIGDHLNWRVAYFIGGAMGIALLVLRVSVHENPIFTKIKSQKHVARGDLRMLLGSPRRMLTFLLCIFAGASIWYAAGLLLTFAPELIQSVGLADTVKVGQLLITTCIGMTLGGIVCGTLSQVLKSHKWPLLIYLGASAAIVIALLTGHIPYEYLNPTYFAIGFFVGIQPIYLLVVSEQFGTNLRATIATAAPNFMRATTVPITSAFVMLKGSMDPVTAALVVGCTVYVICLVAILALRETHGVDLDYLEK